MATRPNYYRLLNLNPDEQNWAAIEKRIDELCHKYNRVGLDATPARQEESRLFKIHLDHPDYGIRKVMQDAKLRGAEADARRKELVEETAQLDTILRLLHARGSYAHTDVEEIAKKFPSFGEKAIEERIKKLGLKNTGTKTKPQPKRPPRPTLTPAEASVIETALLGLRLPDLYAFLGEHIGPTSSPAALEAACQEQKTRLEKLRKGTAEHAVPNAILGHARTQLLDKHKREKYNNYLDDGKLRTLDDLIKFRGGQAKIITEDALNDIIRESPAGLGSERVRDYVEEWVLQRTKGGWIFSVSSKVVAESLLSCGFCGTLAREEHQEKCQDCGRSLQRLCPRPGCGQMVPTSNACCPKCGCTTGDAPLVESLLKQGQTHCEKSQYADAKRCADAVLNLWPDYPAAQQLRAKVDEALRNQAREQERLNELVRDRKLVEAQRLAGHLSSHGCPINQATVRQIDSGITASRSSCEEANRLAGAGQVDAALDKWLVALGHCADYAVAIEAIERHPPSAPTNLIMEAGSKSVRLKWTPAAQHSAIKFVVCRKEGGLPATPEDGRIAEVTGTSVDDTSVSIGKVWYYAVYTALGKTASRFAATSQAILLPGKVTGVAATAIDGEVRLTWNRPPGCEIVEIQRRPSGQIQSVRTAELVENGLQIGQAYSYELSAVYPDPNRSGHFIRSASETIDVRVTARPTPVLDLRADLEGNRVKLSWTPPRIGRL